MLIDSIMIPGEKVITTTADLPLSAAATLLYENRIGLLVVCSDDGQVTGVLSERDFTREVSKHVNSLHEMKVGDLMTPDPITCTPDSYPIDVMNEMKKSGFRHMPVVDDSVLVGLVSMFEITNFLLMT